MADSSDTPKESAPKTARKMRTPAPSLRDTTEKARVRALRPSRGRAFARTIGKPFVWVGRKLGRLGRFKPFHIIGLILWPRFFRNSFAELRKVTWPDRRTTYRLTVAVLVFSLVFGLTVAGLDWGLDKIFRKVILQQ